MAYTATQSPFPITHHNAALAAIDDGEGSRLTWITDIESAAVADALRPVLEAEFDVIASPSVHVHTGPARDQNDD